MEYWEEQKEPLCPGFDSVAKKEIYCEKKIAGKFFRQSSHLDISQKREKKDWRKAIQSDGKRGIREDTVVKKSNSS